MSKMDELSQKIAAFKTQRESKFAAENKESNQGTRAAGEFFAHIFAGCIIGYFIDRGLNSTPIGFMVFMFLGIITGFYRLQVILKYDADDSIGFAPLQKDKKDAKNAPKGDQE